MVFADSAAYQVRPLALQQRTSTTAQTNTVVTKVAPENSGQVALPTITSSQIKGEQSRLGITQSPQKELMDLFEKSRLMRRGIITFEAVGKLSVDAQKLLFSKLQGVDVKDVEPVSSEDEFIEAVHRFQLDFFADNNIKLGRHGLKADGLLGIKTFTALFCDREPKSDNVFNTFVTRTTGYTVDQILTQKIKLGSEDRNAEYDLSHWEKLDSAELGSLSARFESEGDPGEISDLAGDYGGISYGMYQLSRDRGSLKAFVSWLADKQPELHSKLAGAYNNVQEFNDIWRSFAGTNREVFRQLQHEYTKEAFFIPAAVRLLDEKGFDINNKSLALQQVFWSTVVQHGVGGAVTIFSELDLNESDEDIIRGVYQKRMDVDRFFSKCSKEIRHNLQTKRFPEELTMALSLLHSSSPSPGLA